MKVWNIPNFHCRLDSLQNACVSEVGPNAIFIVIIPIVWFIRSPICEWRFGCIVCSILEALGRIFSSQIKPIDPLILHYLPNFVIDTSVSGFKKDHALGLTKVLATFHCEACHQSFGKVELCTIDCQTFFGPNWLNSNKILLKRYLRPDTGCPNKFWIGI